MWVIWKIHFSGWNSLYLCCATSLPLCFAGASLSCQGTLISAFKITFVSLKRCDEDCLGLRFSLTLPFCLTEFHCHDQQVATASKELTKSGSLKAETVFAMHFTSSVAQRRVAPEVFLFQKIMITKTMARILNVGSQNQACKLKIWFWKVLNVVSFLTTVYGKYLQI